MSEQLLKCVSCGKELPSKYMTFFPETSLLNPKCPDCSVIAG